MGVHGMSLRAGFTTPNMLEAETNKAFANAAEQLPLVQVDYDLPLDTLNRAPDRDDFTFGLTAGHVPGVGGPAMKTVQAWVSFNDGATW